MAEAFDKGRGFTLAVKGRDGEDQAAFLAGERPGAVFVDVEIKPQAKDGRQRQNQRKKRDGSFFQPSSLLTQRNTAARCTRTDSITENARRHKCFAQNRAVFVTDCIPGSGAAAGTCAAGSGRRWIC